MTATVLVAEDDEALRVTLVATLEDAGFTVLEARDGAEAVEVVRARPELQVVLSDIRMPRMDGARALHEIRQLRPDLPVVLMTAFSLERVVQDALGEGAWTVLPKPFDADRTAEVLRRAITRPVVLVVDDVPEQREALRESLIACGCETVCAGSADQALQVLRERVVDVAVVDLVMPDRDGVRVLEDLLRADQSVSVVTMTGYDVPDLIRAAGRRGSRAALRKPFDVAQLLRLVAELRRGQR